MELKRSPRWADRQACISEAKAACSSEPSRFGEEELLQVLELCALGFNNPKYAFTVVKKLRKRFYIEVDG